MERRIIGIGETVLDMVFRGGQPQAAVPGGSTFNALVSLGRTAGRDGVKVIMVTQMGDDPVSDIITSFMAQNNLSTEAVRKEEGHQTTVSMAMLDESSNASYEFLRDRTMPAFKACEIEFTAGDLVIFGSFFAINPETREETRKLITKAKEAGAIIYYDVNFRKSHLAQLAEVKPYIEENCAMSTIVRASNEDIGYLYGCSDAKEVYSAHISRLCTNYICTKGSDCTEVYSQGTHLEFPVEKIETVSTIGAGDNFNAGIVYGLLKGGYTAQTARDLNAEDWKALVPTATLFSQNVCRSLFNYVDPDFADTLKA